MTTKLDRIYDQTPEYIKVMVSKSFDVTEHIFDILDARGRSLKDLADALGMKESEISGWMKGTHNFTLETLASIELAFGVL